MEKTVVETAAAQKEHIVVVMGNAVKGNHSKQET
jgi:hypothetical protein